jgi:acyl-CoA thioesterase
MDRLLDYFRQDRFAAEAGIELIAISPGSARARLKIEPRHLNAAGVLQGGAIFTLADLAFAAASNSRGKLALSTCANVSFLKAMRGGVIEAEAREEAVSRKLCTCTVRVTDEAGELVALFTGTAYRKDEPSLPQA